MRKDQERMFGMSEEDIREQYMNGLTAKLSGLEMVVASILSDAQELLQMDRKDEARKMMNIAKFVLFEMMDQKERV